MLLAVLLGTLSWSAAAAAPTVSYSANEFAISRVFASTRSWYSGSHGPYPREETTAAVPGSVVVHPDLAELDTCVRLLLLLAVTARVLA